MPLTGKIALVTGASRGIGRSIALSLGAKGAVVVGTATTDEGAEKISAELKTNDIKGLGLKFNACDINEIPVFLKSIVELYGAPNILINNAGVTRDNITLRMKADQWDTVINTNLSAVFHLTKACLRYMLKARWGRIISITSVVGVMGNPGQANYTAAKAGVTAFSKSVAQEMGAYGVTVNTVAPGFIETDMTKQLTDEQKAVILDKVPSKRMGQPEEIANAVCFLASDEAAYITGQALHVNGGMCMV